MNEQRMQKAFPVSWDQFHRDARALAWRLREAGPFTAMVTITRGGLVPAAIVARELDLRIVETISIASYDAEGAQEEAASVRGEIRLLKPIAPELMANGGTGILVIDDLVDTGSTARVVRDLLPQAHVATVYAKPLGRPFVQTYITEVSQDTWIYFPWDLGLSFQTPIAHASHGA